MMTLDLVSPSTTGKEASPAPSIAGGASQPGTDGTSASGGAFGQAMAQAIQKNAGTNPAAAADPPASLMLQPVFCLLHASLQASLAHHLADGGRRAGAWIASLPHARVAFDTPGDDPQAFANLNTPQDWVRRQVRQKARQPVATVPQRPPLTP